MVFVGQLPQAQALRYVREADVCVSPFYPTAILQSTSPTKLVEYMAMGKAVVANDHPEQKRVIEESGAGYCVPYEEQPFADAIVKLLKDPRGGPVNGSSEGAATSSSTVLTEPLPPRWKNSSSISSSADAERPETADFVSSIRMNMRAARSIKSSLLIDALAACNRYEIHYLTHFVDGRDRSRNYRVSRIGSGGPIPRLGYIMDGPSLYRKLREIDPCLIYQRVACGYTGVCALYSRAARSRCFGTLLMTPT